MDIPFNKPFFTGGEGVYLEEALHSGKLSGGGVVTRRCQELISGRFGFGKTLLTSSCSDALEMAAMLCRVKEGDEVIVPSFTFVSTALAFVREGARVVFADSLPDHPNIDASSLEKLITPRTRAIAVTHYGGAACDMERVMEVAGKYGLRVVEDAAHAIGAVHNRQALGSIGDIGCVSFHETKNISCGEGGMISVNRTEFEERAQVLWEKGTNRVAMFRGDTPKYDWVDVGSSFLPSEITASFLLAQLDMYEGIAAHRMELWQNYYAQLSPLALEGLFSMHNVSTPHNAHIFYLVCRNERDRAGLINHLAERGILAVFHYQSLHRSKFYAPFHDGRDLPNADRFSECLVRLPLFHTLTVEEVSRVAEAVISYYKRNRQR